MHTIPGGRKQVKLQVVREAGNVRELVSKGSQPILQPRRWIPF